MDAALLPILVDPISKSPLRLQAGERDASPDIALQEGCLIGSQGREFPIRLGIPRFVLTDDAGQLQTQKSFGFKWKQRHTYDSPAVLASHRNWMAERYGFGDPQRMRRYFAERERVLDAGCGSGFSSSTWLSAEWRGTGHAEWVGLDISEAIDVAAERIGGCPGTHFVQGDVLAPPFADGSFDAVFSEGVLHHTPSTRQGIDALARLLRPGGELLFYVYRRKGAVREFTDDYVRGIVADLPEEQAWETLKSLTRLGQALAELNVEVDVPEDIPYLDIKAGRQDVQRLIYWNFAKLFWNPEFSFDENHHINFDWYHPRYAHRHTREELEAWCGESGLQIRHLNEQESGYTVVAVKQ